MGFLRKNSIEFHGETFKALCSDREAYVCVNGKRHDILPKTLLKFKNCSNSKEYVESIEMFAYAVFIVISRSASENLRWRFLNISSSIGKYF